jgi:hypothetical protein
MLHLTSELPILHTSSWTPATTTKLLDNMASQQREEASSLGFLSRPAEMRNRIYELVFVHEEAIYVAASRLRQGQLVLHRRIGDGNDRLIMPGKSC